MGVTSGEREAPFISVSLFEEFLTTVLTSSSDATSIASPPSSVHEHEKLAGRSRGYAWYKEKAERFAEECRMAGGATRAAQIIEGVFAKELAEWDGPKPALRA